MNSRRILSVLIVAVIISAAIVPSIGSASASSENTPQILIDYGNGETQWIDAASEGSYLDVTKESASAAGISLEANSSVTKINEFSNTVIKGSSGNSITTSWKLYVLDEAGNWKYDEKVTASSSYDGKTFAWGFYPDADEVICPVVTPQYPDAWTTIGGSSSSENVSDSYGPENLTTPPGWYFPTNNGFIDSGIVCAGDYLYFTSSGSKTPSTSPALHCLNKDSGEEIWKFEYDIGSGDELTTPLITGDLIILCASNENIYCLDRFNGELYWNEEIPFEPPRDENGAIDWSGRTFRSGPSTPAYDSGALYFGSADGKVYCYSISKEKAERIWMYQTNGSIYYVKPTFATINGERILYIGNYEGNVYAINAHTGSLIWNEQVVNYLPEGKMYLGSVDSISIAPENIIVCCSDGSMSKTDGYMLMLDPLTGEEIWKHEYLTSNPVIQEDGFIFYHNLSVYKLDWEGNEIWKSNDVNYIKGDMTEAGGIIYAMEFSAGGSLITLNADSGKIIQKIVVEPYTTTSYSMVQPTVIDGKVYIANDGGFVYCIDASGSPPPAADDDSPTYGFNHWSWYLIFAIIAAMIILLVYLLKYHDDSGLSEVKRKKRRFVYIAVFGTVMPIIAFFISLSISSGGIMPISDAAVSLVSSIQKTLNGDPLNTMELYIYNARLPRAIGAIAVGVGLSIAGCMYQAIIRNPLVDPYITGVSSGAGCIAVAAMAFNITLPFLSPDSNYIIPVAAIAGGLLAFAATMFIAEKSGGNSVNYILGGVIVGFAFSSIQTIFVSLAGNKLQDVMYWLFGSFSTVSWENAWLIFIPAMGISLISLLWAREFNLVVLGEEQAKQMGLNVRTFNRIMLIIASVLTAICVAFVGIIGFVGLVVPHACRLLMGGDNRLVMPASIILGAMLMLSSDIIARMALMPLELPVGAITAIIGTPVFAYMLIKKGGNYDG